MYQDYECLGISAKSQSNSCIHTHTCAIRCLASHLISFHLELMVLIVDVAAAVVAVVVAVVVVYIQATDCLHSFWKILDFIAFASFHLFPFHIICAERSFLFLLFLISSSSSFSCSSISSLHFSEMTKHRQAPVWLEDYGLLRTLAETSIWIQ